MARRLAAKYRKGRPFEEALRSALYALCLAAKNFNPARGVKFSTFALSLIRWQIVADRHEDESPAHVPIWAQESLRAENDGRQLAATTPEKQARWAAWAKAVRKWKRLDRAGPGNEIGRSLAVFPPDPIEKMIRDEATERLQKAIDSLPEIEREIVLARFPQDQSEPVEWQALRKRLGHSEDWIRARLGSGLETLRAACA